MSFTGSSHSINKRDISLIGYCIQEQIIGTFLMLDQLSRVRSRVKQTLCPIILNFLCHKQHVGCKNKTQNLRIKFIYHTFSNTLTFWTSFSNLFTFNQMLRYRILFASFSLIIHKIFESNSF